MWYDIYKTKSHNALINMVIGPRGYGKTYGAKKYCIENFLKNGEQFIYLRRYKAELELVQETLFADVSLDEKFFCHDIDYHQGTYRIDDEIMGWPLALSTSSHLKSASFPHVTTIVFDEFIVENGVSPGYLKNEVFKLLNFIETVARMRENVRVFMLANSLSFVNPYTIYWRMQMPQGKKICKAVEGMVMVELVGDEEFTNAKLQTGFGKLNQGSEFEKMAVQNQFILDSDIFVEKRPPTATHQFVMKYMGINIGVWYDRSSGLFYCSEDYDPSCKMDYAITMSDHTPNTRLIKGSHRGLLDSILQAFKLGRARFENQMLKSYMTEIFRMTL